MCQTFSVEVHFDSNREGVPAEVRVHEELRFFWQRAANAEDVYETLRNIFTHTGGPISTPA